MKNSKNPGRIQNTCLPNTKPDFFLQNYWVSGLCPSSGILNTGKHKVSETGSVSVFRSGQGDTYSVGSHRTKTTKIKSTG
jgi:hypothetical protein